MATSYKTFLVNCSIQKRPSYVSDNSGHYNLPLFLAFKVNIYIPSIAHILFMLFVLLNMHWSNQSPEEEHLLNVILVPEMEAVVGQEIQRMNLQKRQVI